jgi:hypothetical protein
VPINFSKTLSSRCPWAVVGWGEVISASSWILEKNRNCKEKEIYQILVPKIKNIVTE